MSVLFCSLNSESSPGRSVLLSSLSGSITAFLATQSHLTRYHYSPRIRASSITVVSHRGCSLAKSLSFADEKTRSTLSVGQSRIYLITICSIALNNARLRFNIPRITVVSCFSFLTLVVLMVIAVLSSFIPGPSPGPCPGPTAHPTSVVVVLPAEDGARYRASLYDRRPGFSNLS
jgi:hypothetical protein